jgi:hypothetical protein
MILAAKPAHLDGLRKTHEIMSDRLGLETRLVPKSELRTSSSRGEGMLSGHESQRRRARW